MRPSSILTLIGAQPTTLQHQLSNGAIIFARCCALHGVAPMALCGSRATSAIAVARRTGLPLTDEVHLGDFSAAWGGLPIRKATAGPAIAERTAAVIWATLRRMPEPVFLWNLFPLHPHPASDPLGNRAHTAAERKVRKVFLSQLLLALRPRIVIAIGGDAAAALADMEVPHVRVRHPSYGGHRDFCTGIAAAHGLPIEPAGLPMQTQIGLD